MKTLKAKFGKFAISEEKAKKVNGGVSAICSNGESEWVVCSNTIAGLKLEEEAGECHLV